jgi:hypothetical protein
LVGDARETFAFPGNGSTVNIASPKTLEAVSVLMNEVMDVFQGTPYVHLGADEVGLGGLEKTPEYKQAQQTLGNIKSPHDLYCKFIVDLHGIVAKRGKQAIVWEEAWNAGGAYPLPKDAIVMVWSQGRSPAAIVKSGYAVVNATWTPLYIVRDNKRSLEFLSNWDLTKFGREGSEKYTTLQEKELLRGAQLCSWENSECIEIQSMRDRLALVAERAWNPDAGGTFADFKARLAHTDALLDKLVNPIAIQVQGQLVRDENTFDEPLTVTLTPRPLPHPPSRGGEGAGGGRAAWPDDRSGGSAGETGRGCGRRLGQRGDHYLGWPAQRAERRGAGGGSAGAGGSAAVLHWAGAGSHAGGLPRHPYPRTERA